MCVALEWDFFSCLRHLTRTAQDCHRVLPERSKEGLGKSALGCDSHS